MEKAKKLVRKPRAKKVKKLPVIPEELLPVPEEPVPELLPVPEEPVPELLPEPEEPVPEPEEPVPEPEEPVPEPVVPTAPKQPYELADVKYKLTDLRPGDNTFIILKRTHTDRPENSENYFYSTVAMLPGLDTYSVHTEFERTKNSFKYYNNIHYIEVEHPYNGEELKMKIDLKKSK